MGWGGGEPHPVLAIPSTTSLPCIHTRNHMKPSISLFDEPSDNQSAFALDDGSGLRIVHANFDGESQFTWDLFRGYDCMRVLTYSASTSAIVRMLDNYSFETFECVFGYEGTLREIKSILAFQKVVVGDTRAAIMGLKDERHIRILKKIHSGKAHFRVLRESIAHAKLYLLSAEDGRRRVVIGSANLSERAFSGKQSETLVVFDDDERAWSHYNRMFDDIRNSASDEIPLPKEKIINAEIEVSDAPVVSGLGTVVIEASRGPESQYSSPVQIQRVEKVVEVFGPRLSGALPAIRNGKQTITPEIKRKISRIRLVKSVDEADNRYLSIDRANHTALLSGEPFSLEWNHSSLKGDCKLLLEYFANYDGAFEGNVEKLQRDYFTLMSWLCRFPGAETTIRRRPGSAVMISQT